MKYLFIFISGYIVGYAISIYKQSQLQRKLEFSKKRHIDYVNSMYKKLLESQSDQFNYTVVGINECIGDAIAGYNTPPHIQGFSDYMDAILFMAKEGESGYSHALFDKSRVLIVLLNGKNIWNFNTPRFDG